MNLEGISKVEGLIKEALIQLTNEISNNYLERNEIAMDAKMYMSLNQLYLKMKREKNLN